MKNVSYYQSALRKTCKTGGEIFTGPRPTISMAVPSFLGLILNARPSKSEYKDDVTKWRHGNHRATEWDCVLVRRAWLHRWKSQILTWSGSTGFALSKSKSSDVEFVELCRECPLKKRKAHQMCEIHHSFASQNPLSVKLTEKEAGRVINSLWVRGEPIRLLFGTNKAKKS